MPSAGSGLDYRKAGPSRRFVSACLGFPRCASLSWPAPPWEGLSLLALEPLIFINQNQQKMVAREAKIQHIVFIRTEKSLDYIFLPTNNMRNLHFILMIFYHTLIIHQEITGYENTGAFKLFLADVGLLAAMPKLAAKIILEGDALFAEFKGALTEQYALQEMSVLDDAEIAYWVNDGATAEVDFILQIGGKIIPVEVKSSTNLKAKSLSVYRGKYHPEIEIRASLADFNKTANLYDVPLYALGALKEIIQG
ncbi:MAG: DUF4143 domain-containing protein [Gracilibacteraceae bacterium]|jgi:hypothetical protein|nr:DUF4143 domain-containing protein [Gracilibacteraceae bacterium]